MRFHLLLYYEFGKVKVLQMTTGKFFLIALSSFLITNFLCEGRLEASQFEEHLQSNLT